MSSNEVERQGEMHCTRRDVRRVATSEEQLRDELLWGIPNGVTLEHIATSLPWRSWQIVATLSADWERAFQGRMVYDARIRTQTTETFFIALCELSFNFRKDVTVELHKRTFSLFSPREERWHKLPPIPGCRAGMPHESQYVLLDGAMYVLGGTRRGRKNVPSAEVHVLDLARHPLEWRRCANMQVPRQDHHIGVMHGKIFVFGGIYNDDIRDEVYDPKADTWSWIAPIIPSAFFLNVLSVGQRYFLCRGEKMSTMPAGGEPVSEAEKPVRDDEADKLGDTKLVVTVGARGPKLCNTGDDEIEDDMDGLHEIIENQIVDLEKSAPPPWSPAKSLAYEIKWYEQHRPNSFLRAYDPVKDEWRAFEREILGTDDVDLVGPEHLFDLGPNAGHPQVWTSVWKISL